MRRALPWLLIGALLLGNVLATYWLFTSRYPGANDFASRWAGARAFWNDGVSPYSDEATRQIQLLIYGRPVLPAEESELDPGPFAYPFHTVFLLWPLVALPYPWAEAVWLVILEICLGAGVLLAMRVVGWQPRAGLVAATTAWAFLFYPAARAILLGQFAVPVFAAILLALWSWKTRREILCGISLALATVKPQMVFLLVPLLLAQATGERRGRILVAFFAATGVLVGASCLTEPGWILSFFRQMARYPSYTALGSPIWILTHLMIPGLGAWGEVALTALVIGYLLWESVQSLRIRSTERLIWAAGVCLIITNLVALRTATTNYVALYLPMMMVFRALERQRGGIGWVLLSQAVLLIGMWALFLSTLVGKFEHPLVYLPLPIGLLLVFIIWRYRLIPPAGQQVPVRQP
jgi:hypothetical protein